MELVQSIFKCVLWTYILHKISANEIKRDLRSANPRFSSTWLIPKSSNHLTTAVNRRSGFNHEISDCFDTKKVENCLDKKSIRNVVRNLVLDCCHVCPGEVYASYESYSKANDESTVLVSTKTKKRSIKDRIAIPKKRKFGVSKESVEAEEFETEMSEPSPAILSGIIQPLIPTSIWESLTGREFYFLSTLGGLIKAGISVCMPKSEDFVDWKAADSKTRKLLESSDVHALQNALKEDDILVWVGKFKQEGHGSHLPLVKTVSILPMSPRNMAALLMDSTKVTSYNKMSLGRDDEVVFQEGIDTEVSSEDSNLRIDGEAKIVRNLTKPPLSKKLMEFVTVMYARKLRADDDVGPGVVGAPGADGGYVVVSRAVNGGKWNPHSSDSEDQAERTRSEILLGVNLIRSVHGSPDVSLLFSMK